MAGDSENVAGVPLNPEIVGNAFVPNDTSLPISIDINTPGAGSGFNFDLGQQFFQSVESILAWDAHVAEAGEEETPESTATAQPTNTSVPTIEASATIQATATTRPTVTPIPSPTAEVWTGEYQDLSNARRDLVDIDIVASPELGGIIFYDGVVPALTLMSKQDITNNIVEYVFRRKILGGENYFRIRFAWDYPDSGGWSSNNWLMHYDVDWPVPGENAVLGLIGVDNYKIPQDQAGSSWPRNYREVYGNLQEGSLQSVQDYFNSGVIDPSWSVDESGIVDLTQVVGAYRVTH